MAKKDHNIIRIALIGPESTSKSTLSEELATHYNTLWIKEYSREYLQNKTGKYNLEDIINISKHQLKQEQDALKLANKFLFIDTELIISKVWAQDFFNNYPSWIEENLIKHKYDLYLLTYYDLPWIADPLRENPDRREYFFNWYERELKLIDAEYAIIKGIGSTRLENSIIAIENFLTKIKN